MESIGWKGAFREISFPLKYSGALGIFRFIRARITECFITFELRAVQAYPGIKKKALLNLAIIHRFTEGKEDEG